MSRYLVVALDRTPPPELRGYVAELLTAGVEVSLVVVDEDIAARFRGELPPDARLDVRALVPSESALLAGRLGRLLGGRLRPRFDRIYRALARPWVLGRRWRTVDATTRPAGTQRLVAADFGATTLIWRLCRRYPHIVATTALDPPGPRSAS